MAQRYLVECFFVGALQMRCSIVTDIESGDCIIIDGGSEAEKLIQHINGQGSHIPDNSNGLVMEKPRKVVALVNTHAHFDHSGEIPILKEYFGVEWWLHEDDFFLQSLAQNSAMRWGFRIPEPAVADHKLEHDSEYEFGSISLKVTHTPGHTLGGCCLQITDDDGDSHLFVGDTLFAGSVGRTDLPNSGGDFDLLSRMIKTRLWPMDDDVIVYPGHGPLTTIGHERRTNPFVGDSTGDSGIFTRGRYS